MRKALLFLIAGSFVFSSFKTTPVPVAGKILEFCKMNFGKKVDRGECWDLAYAALNYANADWSMPFNFGDKVEYKKEGLKPADVLQFTDAKFLFPNRSMSFPQHTAIVYKVDKTRITVYHQNFNNKKYVDTLTFTLENITKGKIDAYRPKGKQ